LASFRQSITNTFFTEYRYLRAVRAFNVFCRLVLRKHVHKKTIIHGGKEETLVTETTRVEQDSDPPADLGPSIDAVIHQFMSSDKFGAAEGSSADARDDGAAGPSSHAP